LGIFVSPVDRGLHFAADWVVGFHQYRKIPTDSILILCSDTDNGYVIHTPSQLVMVTVLLGNFVLYSIRAFRSL